eukprot:gene35595-47865_t
MDSPRSNPKRHRRGPGLALAEEAKKSGERCEASSSQLKPSIGRTNTAAQLAAFRRAGIDKVVQEKRSAVKQRPALDKLLTVLVKGDVLVVYKLDRLARSVSHFVKVFEYLKAKGVGFRSLTESIETDTAHGRMFLHLLSAFAEFERELIRERCLAGQRAARAAGKTWGRKRALSDDDVAQAAFCWRSGWYDQRTLADMLGVSVSSLRDHIHRHEGRGRWLLLKALVERYIADGQPVGSRTLSRASGLDLSPATIRNVM